jgi:hypothetical protein
MQRIMPRGENFKNKDFGTRIKPLEDIGEQKLYDKVFGVRLPIPAAKKLMKLDTKDRTLLIRRAVLKELENSS